MSLQEFCQEYGSWIGENSDYSLDARFTTTGRSMICSYGTGALKYVKHAVHDGSVPIDDGMGRDPVDI